MRNSKKLLIGVLSVAALIGTGYAAWTIGGVFTDATQELNPIVEETIGTRDIALKVSKDENDNIKFDSKADLSVTYNVKAVKAETNLIEGFDPYDLSYYDKVAEDYQPDLTVSARALDSTTGDPLDPSDEFFKIVNLPKEVTYEYKQWLAEDYKDNGFPVELVFTWGDFTGGLNPQEYLDSQLASKTQEEQKEFIQGVIDNLKGVKFEFTFKVEGAVIDDPEPVEDTTGEVTAPSVANSTFLIDGQAISGNLKAGQHQITITTADGKVVEDNKLIVVENGADKEVMLTDSLTRAAHTYSATCNFLKGATYSFKYDVVDEVIVEEPVVFEQGKLGYWQVNLGKAYYFTGEKSGNFGTSTEVFDDAADLTVYKHNNGKYTIEIDGGKYLGAIVSTKYTNFNIQDDEYFWDYDETYDTYTTDAGNGKVFMGTYSNYDTFSLSSYDYIDKEGNSIAHIDKFEITAPEAQDVSISANPTTIKVGGTSELSFDLSPIGSQIDGEIVYEVSGANDGVVSLKGNIVTGLKEGSVQIVGEIGGLTSEPITINVITDDTPVGDSVVYEYDPHIPSGGISGNIYGSDVADPNKALETLNATSNELTNKLINEVTSAEKIYTHSDQESSGIKFSTGSANGKLAFTTTAEVSKFAISYISWGSESTTVTVKAGEQEFSRARQADDTNTSAVTLTCELNPSSKSFEISVTKRIVITKLEFWLA